MLVSNLDYLTCYSRHCLAAVAAVAAAEWSLSLFRTLITPGVMALGLLAMMTAEMWTCYHKKHPLEHAQAWWMKHVRTKMVIFTLVIVAFLLDGTVILVGSYINHNVPTIDVVLPVWGNGFLPVTIVTIVWLITAEAIQTMHNVGRHAGYRYVAPVILWAVQQLRKIDAARLPPGAQPNKRLLDNLKQEDIEELLHKLEDRDLLDPLPPPLGGEEEEDPKPKKKKG